jgi:hypothetical protein
VLCKSKVILHIFKISTLRVDQPNKRVPGLTVATIFEGATALLERGTSKLLLCHSALLFTGGIWGKEQTFFIFFAADPGAAAAAVEQRVAARHERRQGPVVVSCGTFFEEGGKCRVY